MEAAMRDGVLCGLPGGSFKQEKRGARGKMVLPYFHFSVVLRLNATTPGCLNNFGEIENRTKQNDLKKKLKISFYLFIFILVYKLKLNKSD